MDQFYDYLLLLDDLTNCGSASTFEPKYKILQNTSSGLPSLDNFIKIAVITASTNYVAVLSRNQKRYPVTQMIETLLFQNDTAVLEWMNLSQKDLIQIQKWCAATYKETQIENLYKNYVNEYPELNIVPENLDDFRQKLSPYMDKFNKIIKRLPQNADGYLTQIRQTDDYVEDIYNSMILNVGTFFVWDNGEQERFKIQNWSCLISPVLPFTIGSNGERIQQMREKMRYTPTGLVRLSLNDQNLYDDVKTETKTDPEYYNLDKLSNYTFQQYIDNNNTTLSKYPFSEKTCMEPQAAEFFYNGSILELAYDSRASHFTTNAKIDNSLGFIIGRPKVKTFNLLYVLADFSVHLHTDIVKSSISTVWWIIIIVCSILIIALIGILIFYENTKHHK